MSDYPVGSLGYERERIMREARETVAAMPIHLRWIGRRWLKGIQSQDAALGAIIDSHQQAIVDDILDGIEADAR